MKKITTLLLTSACALTITNSLFGMENNSDENNILLRENNLLLRTLITQNNILFEYHGKLQTTNHPDYRHKKTETKLDNLYQSTNAQISNKSRHIPIMNQTKK